jgi:hypothetical protein
VVVAHALDRLSRDQNHLGLLFSECDHKGVRVEFVIEQLEDTPEGKLLQAIRGYVASVERLKIRERTQRGVRARAQSGKLLSGGKPVYGYRWLDDTKGALDMTRSPGLSCNAFFGTRLLVRRCARSPSVDDRARTDSQGTRHLACVNRAPCADQLRVHWASDCVSRIAGP